MSELSVKDKRKDSRQVKHPVKIDHEALEVALAVTGVTFSKDTKILLRITDAVDGKPLGYTRRLAKDAFLVKVALKPGKTEPRHHYFVNNTLVHELRHVAQMQLDPAHNLAYALETAEHGYNDNKYEVEARYFGRLADHTGTKDTGPAGKPLGEQVWAVRMLG